MAIVLAIPYVYSLVVADLAVRSPDVVPFFGWSKVPRQKRSYAVMIWVPGDPSGNAGKDLPPRNIGENPRNVADFDELFQVQLAAHDASKPADDLAQYNITRLLYNDFRAALYLSAHGTVFIDSISWNLTGGADGRLGGEILCGCRLRSPVPDLLAEASEISPVSALLKTFIPNTEVDVLVTP
jgi:hypothetical protein